MRMKSITIGELHEHTEQLVMRAAEEDGFVITTQGMPVAILRPARAPEAGGKPLPKRDPQSLPTTKADSTLFISEERDSR
jgi:antitoxin (DNA-binding transcriptional repressor) of toxin-antitoxin stability system